MNTRNIAIKILINFEKDLTFKPHFEKLTKNLIFKDRSFVRELTAGTIRYLKYLDFAIEKASGKKQKKQKAVVRNALRILAYQIYFMSVPSYAAINETVEAVKKFHKKAAGFVNAVGKKLLNFNPKIEIEKIENYIERLSILYSFESFMVERWLKFYGSDEIENLLTGLNKTASIFLRINTLKIEPIEFHELLKSSNIKFEVHPFLKEMVRIVERIDIKKIPGYKRGLFYVQDPASYLSAVLLNPKENENILEIAAAPGGKTTAIAALTRNKSFITAVDVSEERLNLLRENLQKAGVRNCRVFNADLTKNISFERESFDRILIDAPCSGTGVIRRHPEGKWNKSISLIKHNQKIQQNLLKAAYKLLKPGGTLLYSTCSLEKEEGEENIDFATSIGFKEKEFDVKFKELDNAFKNNTLRVFPHKHSMDGFFYGILTK